MKWEVSFHDDFEAEFDVLPEPVQDSILAKTESLGRYRSKLEAPRADTLVGSRHANMKELRRSGERGLAHRFRVRSGEEGHSSDSRRQGRHQSEVFFQRPIAKADERFELRLAAQERVR